MHLFMLTNGLLKTLCQLIAITADHSSLSRDEKDLLLSDCLHLCKLIIIFTIR